MKSNMHFQALAHQGLIC
uniref:Uncharacterized protein n=1 Tax=Arundo donax TaxID=35708 RepID=A0A0A9C1A1_ARUDO